MDVFEIRTGSGETEICLVYCYEKSGTCIIELSPDARAEEMPAALAAFRQKGIFTLNPVFSESYGEYGFREEGCLVRRPDEEPVWMEDRKKHWLLDAALLPGARVFLSFRDGRCGIANLQAFLSLNRDISAVMKPDEEAAGVKLTGGGRVLFFGGGRFLMSEDLYAGPLTGITSAADLFCIEQARYVDVPDICREMGVSRQYVNRRLAEKGIRPFRKCGGNNLYLRSEVQALLDY